MFIHLIVSLLIHLFISPFVIINLKKGLSLMQTFQVLEETDISPLPVFCSLSVVKLCTIGSQ